MKSQARLKKPKILVVDDEPDNLDLLYRTFHREYKVLKAESGPKGLEVLAQTPDIAVIISDQRMPIMSGTEFLSLAAVQYPDIIRIILTGYTDVEDLVEAINSGKVFKYVTKPWEADFLKDIVRQALDTHNVLKIRTDELSRSLKRETLLNTVTNTIRNAQYGRMGESPLKDVLQTIVDTVGHMLGVDLCILRTFDEDDAIEGSFAYEKKSNPTDGEILSGIDNAALDLTIWETQEVQIINDIETCEFLQGDSPEILQRLKAFQMADIRSTLIIPLISQGDLTAVMALHRCRELHFWEDDEIQLAVMVADQAALAISQARSYERVQSLAKREALVNTIASGIRSSLDPQEIFMAVTQQLGSTLEVDGCALSLWTEEDEFVKCVGLYDRASAWVETEADPALSVMGQEAKGNGQRAIESDRSQSSLPQSVVPISGNPVLQELLKTREPVVVMDMEDENVEEIKGVDLPLRSPARALLVVPLLVDEQIIGSITLRQSSKPRRWSHADIELAQAVASQAAIAVQQSRLFQQTRQQAERLMESDRQKTEFFQNISHEFRTPLTLMIGPLESAIDRQEDLPFDRAQIALRNSRRLLRLVNQLLDLQRLDAGRMQPSFRPCNLAEFSEQIVETFRPYCQRKGLHLETQLEATQTIYLDGDKFDKVLYNLLSNAMKFTEAGGKITITLKSLEGRVCLQVRDTGIGISPSQITHLFERFRQAEGSVNRSYEGTGLGLALVKEIVELHGGEVSVSSVKLGEEREGEIAGTTFTVLLYEGTSHLTSDLVLDLPLEMQAARSAVELADLEAELLEAEETREIEAIAPLNIPEYTNNPNLDFQPGDRLVLVVDDNPDLRSYVSSVLRSAGYRVCTARNGAEGYRMTEEQRPQLIVSDVMMPKVSGLDLVKMVRNNEELRGTPIILLTAKADEGSRLQGTEQGADAYLAKPFNDRELLASTRNLLSLKANEERVKKLNTYLTEAVLQRFLPPEMVQKAARGEMTLGLEPEPRLITILFSDIVGFTKLSNQLESQGIARVLNEYLQVMTEVVFEYGGTVDKFMGDAIIALFGAPQDLSPEEQVRRSIGTAKEMYRVLDELNDRWRKQGIIGVNNVPPVQFRCGIHQGKAVVGMFGSQHRSDYTAIGPSVNIASRLQEAATPSKILVSATVADYLSPEEKEKFKFLQLKGIEYDVLTYFINT
ncbi:response regulator [Spirulina sp. 06S082]|uniref:response regulator n=1 Tax=Spirulina sp. 06S082 TaxID=3110248 RepID=UPI002B1FA70D|nr:response regulator [Spirulina sp. 06S082]MEA5470524.1 response regulator [Spirulina sp. 06S082]